MKNLNIFNYPIFGKFLFLVFGILFFSTAIKSQQLSAMLSYTTFDSPEKGPYIETYLSVAGNSVTYYRKDDNKFQAHLQIVVLFKQGEEIVNFDKYELASPETVDTTNINFDFIDQQRYSLKNGTYDFEIQIWDNNEVHKPFISVQPIEINYPKNEVRISGIELVNSFKPTKENSKFSKNGYDLVPHNSNFYPESMTKLIYYAEIYNTTKVLEENSQFLISTFIHPLNSDKPLPEYISYKKQNAKEVNIVFGEFDISQLKSGNYYLVIEARNRENVLLSKNRIFIQRSNPGIKIKVEDLMKINVENTFASQINNKDTLMNYINSLTPIADGQEQSFMLANGKDADIETMQRFFYNFWYNRDQLEPQKKWENYQREVNKVNMAYSTIIQKGFETDRGRVFLKYGPPNAISESYNEPSTYPYEIWHYYTLENGQRNKRFVFYTKDIVTNDFVLVHSDVIGELANFRWQNVIYRGYGPASNIDQGTMPDSWGGNSKRYFDLPR